MTSKLCWVSGRVQGVYYRGTAVNRARTAGICGYALNLPDGRVEVLVQGPEVAVEAFIQWLWIGSVACKVTAVEVRDASATALRAGFTSE
ncbi:MAG TPA: acylphosphatase [Steroidobacteraceae bacterium]|nr:acylphosphatase [Steroidobacteraceae bacterium]